MKNNNDNLNSRLNNSSNEPTNQKLTGSCDVSVIMPTYNCLYYLPMAIASVLSQKVDLELLIVDDGSDDGSGEWLAHQAAHNDCIRIIKGEHKGVSAARNLAIAEARGEYVAFLDADDYWYDDKLRLQLAYHKSQPDLVLSFTDYDHFSESDEDLGRCFTFWPRFNRLLQDEAQCLRLTGALKTSVYEENVIGTSTVMVRTDALQKAQGFDETLHSASDWDLWLRLLDFGDFMAIKPSLMGYLVRQNSISRNVERRLKSFELILDRFQPAMVALNPACVAPARARLALAWAEAWQEQKDGYWKAIGAYTKACYQLPTSRNLKALAAHIIRG